MKQLPFEKQCAIMNAIRKGDPYRLIALAFNIPKSRVQDYKKNGPPFSRRFAKNPSVGPFPSLAEQDNEWFRKAFQEMERVSWDALQLRNDAQREISSLTRDKTTLEEDMKRMKDENLALTQKKEEMEKQVQTLTKEKEEREGEISEKNQMVTKLMSVIKNLDGENTVLKNPDQTCYSYGQVVTLTATPIQGWSFYYWSGDTSGSDPVTTVTME